MAEPGKKWRTSFLIYSAALPLLLCQEVRPAELSSASASSPSPSATAAPSAKPATPEEADFRKVQDLYAKGDFEGALSALDAMKSRYPRGKMIAQAENLTGLCYLLTKRPKQALAYFKMAIKGNPNALIFNQYVLYNQAKAELEAELVADAEQTLARIDPKVYDKENKVKYHYLRAALFQKKTQHLEAAREILQASRDLEGSQIKTLRSGFSGNLDAAIKDVQGNAPLEDLYREFEDSPLADTLLFRLATREQQQGEGEKADGHLKLLTTRFPQSDHFQQAVAILQAREAESPIDPTAIGVLLPMKGKFAKFGARSLQGIEYAFKIFDHTKQDSKITLVIEDSGEEPDQAVRALNRLVTKHHVIAVIGPLLSKGIDAVSKRAQELHVPMLSLARQTGTPSEYVIPAGLTLQLQAYEVAKHAISRLKLKRFAILAPKDKLGDEYAQYFWDAVESLGGEVRGIESYSPGETDFRQPVDKLSGLYYTEARQAELEELAKLREVNQIKKRTRKTEQFYNLKPIVDYQAVFVPDEPKVAGQILPTFAYRDVDQITFLGPSAWNSPEFPSRAQKMAESSYFVDAYFAESRSNEVRGFIDGYKGVFEQDPTAMDALSYDAAKLLEKALIETGTAGRRGDLLSKLKAIKDYRGVTGLISFKDGQYSRDLRNLTVRAGQVIETR